MHGTYNITFSLVLHKRATSSHICGRADVDTVIKSAVQLISATGKLHLRDGFQNLWQMFNQDTGGNCTEQKGIGVIFFYANSFST
jgi:hypothetical protein